MIRPLGLKRVSLGGTLFAFWLLVSSPLQASGCLAFAPDEWAVINYVHDGDTIKLSDGRNVRLIGINTPELGRDGRPNEAFAIEARDVLRQMLPQGSQVALRLGREAEDKYGRLLAHVYTADQRNVQLELLSRGLAAAVAVTPNILNLDCYLAAELTAANQGIWQQAAFKGVEIDRLNKRARGFHILRGKVLRVGESRKAIWLNFEGGLAARIDKRDLKYFDIDPKQWVGQRLRLRGWVYAYKGKPQLKLQHSGLVEVLN